MAYSELWLNVCDNDEVRISYIDTVGSSSLSHVRTMMMMIRHALYLV